MCHDLFPTLVVYICLPRSALLCRVQCILSLVTHTGLQSGLRSELPSITCALLLGIALNNLSFEALQAYLMLQRVHLKTIT